MDTFSLPVQQEALGLAKDWLGLPSIRTQVWTSNLTVKLLWTAEKYGLYHHAHKLEGLEGVKRNSLQLQIGSATNYFGVA
jgi:hypothetical protein